ncbi:chromosome partitioning protein ParB, partial [Salmonella enterica]|nr:chromosome partitioning protein ParB [Salmonella enterica]
MAGRLLQGAYVMTKNFEIVYRNPAELIPYEMNA